MRLVLVLPNIRSAHNVGSLLRTADGLGVDEVYLCGYTPYPSIQGDTRLAHVRARADKQIHKAALGAEASQAWSYRPELGKLLKTLKGDGFKLVALEQSQSAKKLTAYKPKGDIALIVGNEVEGLVPKTLKSVDLTLEIPMLGAKESFNVAVAGAIALYHLRFMNKT